MQQINQDADTLKKHDHDLEERESKRNWKTPKVVQRGVKKTEGKEYKFKETGQGNNRGPS